MALMSACYVCYDGIDLVNSARARAYTKTGGGNSCGLSPCYGWPDNLCTPDLYDYTTPAADDDAHGDVWWWDPDQPGYSDIIGVTGTELSVKHGVRTGVGRSAWGGYSGPTRYGPLEIQLKATMWTRSEAGTAAAHAMLLPALLGSLCQDTCRLPDLTFYRACSCGTGPDLLRVIKGARFIAQDFETDDEFPRSCGVRFTATFQSTSPYIWWPDIEWLFDKEPITGAVCGTVCDQCPETSDTTCKCGCLANLPLPSRQLNTVGCGCDPFVVKRMCVPLDAPSLWNPSGLIINVAAGSEELRNLRIRAWANPTGLPSPSGSNNPFRCARPCVDISIGCVPKQGVLTVDGTTRDATIRCVDGTVQPAITTLSSGGRGLKWPEITGCTPLMVCIDADGINTADDATISLGVQRAELA